MTSQNLEELKKYTWENEPNYFKYNQELEGLIGVKDKMIVDFEYDDNGNLIEYHLIHKAYILNADDEIEAYNKLYLPATNSTSELKEIKARVIKKNGDTHVLDKSKILTSKDEETNIESKYYAFEGVEKGSIIEYYYILKRAAAYSGEKKTIQFDYINNNYEFDLYCPTNLIFKLKSYNKLSEVVLDTNSTDQNHWQLNIEKVVALEYEEQSAYNARKMFFIYKLDRNTATNKRDLSSYSSIAKNVYDLYYSEKSKTELKAIRKLINNTDCKIARNKAGKIRAIEDHIKSTFYIVSQNNQELSDISRIIINKTASFRGILKLYVAILNELEIKHQIGLTSDRYLLKFDKKFEASNFLTDYLIYFPELKSYMSPTSIGSRLGFPLPEFTNTYGLFIKEINVNNMKTGLAKIRFIEPVDYKKSFDEMIIDIHLDTNDINKSIVKFDRSTGGYYAINTQPFMNFYKDEDKTEIIDGYIKYLSKDISILNKTVFYDDAKYFGIEPFKVSAEFHLAPFIENAGEKTILKVGNLIGPQAEMYQEKERILPIENQFKRNYHRIITIKIPKKYKIKNVDDLNIDNEYVKDSKTLLSFKSSYTFENNTLIITVDEYYNMIDIEPSFYNTYRKIINSAADFNKISLVLE
jgi:hypothetical protein